MPLSEQSPNAMFWDIGWNSGRLEKKIFSKCWYKAGLQRFELEGTPGGMILGLEARLSIFLPLSQPPGGMPNFPPLNE